MHSLAFRAHFGQVLSPEAMDNVVPSPPAQYAPFFNRDGTPKLGADAQILTGSFTQAAHAAWLLAKAEVFGGREMGSAALRAVTLKDLAGLSPRAAALMPYWRPSDIYVTSSDGYVILAVRSNRTLSTPGKAIYTAAGFPKLINGMPENAGAAALRELEEETGLTPALIGGEIEPLGITDAKTYGQRHAEYYQLSTQNGEAVHGIVPTLGIAFALRATLKASDILPLMRMNSESVGVILLRKKELEKLSGKNLPVMAPFVPLDSIFAKRAVTSLFCDTLMQVRLAVVHARAMNQEERAERARLQKGFQPLVVRAHDLMHGDNHENMDRMRQALQPPRPRFIVNPGGAHASGWGHDRLER